MPGQRLHLSAEQRLQQSLSPLQVRYFKMLEMNDTQVEDEVRRVLDENPALEIADSTPEADTYGETAEEMQLADYRSEDDVPSYRLEARNHSADDRRFEPQAVASSGSLYDSLEQQLALTGLDERSMAIGRYIIGNLDDNGYLTRTPDVMADDIAMATGIDVAPTEVRRVLDTVRRLDPPGIGAVDLRDCLLLQLRRKDPGEPGVADALEIVGHYFDLFSKRHFDRIMSATGIGRQRLSAAVEAIRALNPKPGGSIGDEAADERLRQVSPDFAVETDPEGNVTVSMLSRIPELQLEQTFADDAPAPAPARARGRNEADAFIRSRREEARGFIRILTMRAETLMRVMTAIARLQSRFFATGNEADLRPMVLRDVSAVTGDDPSVISRVTAGKYVATPWGTFPLKHFFNEKFSAEAPETSSREILAALRDVIDNEDKHSPLNDEALRAVLAERGIDVARRTVAKYRGQLNIPVARLRRTL